MTIEDIQPLSAEAFAKAAHFIKTQARPLEQALYAREFAGAGTDDIIAALRVYQNDDGGFGALESDFGSDASSVLNTTHALQILSQIGLDVLHDLVASSMQYLLATYDPAITGWPIIPPHDNSAPHAPWWHYSDDFPTQWNHFQDNPRPEVLGYLYRYPVNGSADIAQTVSEALTARLPDLGELMVNMLVCYMRLYETDAIPAELKTHLVQYLPAIARQSIERDPSDWENYVTKPLEVIHSPDSLFHDEFKDAVAANIRYEIAAQAEDGAWDPNWNWGGTFPDAWDEARRKWRGILTLERLRVLRTSTASLLEANAQTHCPRTNTGTDIPCPQHPTSAPTPPGKNDSGPPVSSRPESPTRTPPPASFAPTATASCNSTPGTSQKDLKKARDQDHIFVFFHRPIYTLKEENALHQLFVEYGVSAVIYGHFHHHNSRERDGIPYIMTVSAAHIMHPPLPDEAGSFHHLLLVTVREQSFRIAVLKADSVLPIGTVSPEDNQDLYSLQQHFFSARELPFSSLKRRGDDYEVILRVNNPSSQDLTAFFEWQLPNERWAVDPLKSRRVSLPAGTKDLAVEFTLHRKFPHLPEAFPSCLAKTLYLTSDGDVAQFEHVFKIVADPVANPTQ